MMRVDVPTTDTKRRTFNQIVMTIALPSSAIIFVISAWIYDPMSFLTILPMMLINFIILYGAIVMVAWIEHQSYRAIVGIAFIIFGIVMPTNWSLTYILVGGILLFDGLSSIWKRSFLDHVREGGILFGLAMIVGGAIVGFVFESWNHYFLSGWIIDPTYLPFPSVPILGVPLAVMFAWVVACIFFLELVSFTSVFFTHRKQPCTPNSCDLSQRGDRCLI